MKSVSQLFNESSNDIDVYRIEHKTDKKGPYQAELHTDNGSVKFYEKFPQNPRDNPAPMKDNSLKDAVNKHDVIHKDISWWIREGVFAFTSIQQMRKWFTKKGIMWLTDELGTFNVIKKSIPSDSVAVGELQSLVLNKAWNKSKEKIIKI